MLEAIQRYAVLIGGMILTAFVCVKAAPFLISPGGDIGPSVLASESPSAAATALLVVIAISTVIAGVVGRLSNSLVGMFVLGVGLFALDGRTETIRALAYERAADSATTLLTTLAVEALLIAAVLLAATLVVFAIGGPLRDVEPRKYSERPHRLWSVDALKMALAGVIVLLAVTLFGQSPMKGQMVAAAFLGAMVAGLIGRLLSPHVQPALVFVAPTLFGALGYVVCMFMAKSPLDVAYVIGRLPALAQATPLDYAAGSLMGVAVGLGWAKSFLHHDEPAAAAAVSA